MVSRRGLLRALGLSVTAGLAGCNALNDGKSDPTATGTATATMTTTPTATLPPTTDRESTTSTETPTGSPTGEGEGSILRPLSDTTEEFGQAVALSDVAAVVLAEASGAHVFEADGGWRPTTVLTPDEQPDFGGYHVSATMVGREAILGGPSIGSEGGEVYLFEQADGRWQQRHRFVPDEDRNDFGRSVAFDGDRVVVGDNNDPTTMQSWSGSAYVFARDGSGWTQEAAVGRNAENLFGTAVAVDGETVLVGAPFAEPDGEETGAVYSYALINGEWQRRATLTADETVDGSQFGQSVAIEGNTAIIGAPGSGGGSGYVFERTRSGWKRRARLTAGETEQNGALGWSVAYADGVAVLGAPKVGPAGRAYAFEMSDDWTETRHLCAKGVSENAEFGFAVAMHNRTALVGAPVFREPSRAYLFEL